LPTLTMTSRAVAQNTGSGRPNARPEGGSTQVGHPP
jgi:hypothetical protein